MKVTLLKNWNGRLEGDEVGVSKDRAKAMADAGFIAPPKKIAPATEKATRKPTTEKAVKNED